MTATRPGAPLRIAHAYGNSRRLVQLAFESGVDVIEADVRLQRDGLWLAHDRRLLFWWFLFGKQAWSEAPQRFWAFLLHRRPWLDGSSFPLADLLDLVADRCGVLLDLKIPLMPDNRRRFVALLSDTLQNMPPRTHIRLCGDWPLLDAVRSEFPDLKLYYSVADRRRWRGFVRRIEHGDGIRGVSLRGRLFHEVASRFVREKGVEVICWPVDSEAEVVRVTGLGAAGIISYNLALLKSIGGAAAASRR